MEALKNPCLGCDLLEADKNCPECKNCSKRVSYINDPRWSSVTMDGDAGKSIRERIEELDDLAAEKFQLTIGGVEAEEEMEMTRAEEIEILIKDICDDCFTSVDSLQGGRRKPEDTKARRKIIACLMSDDFKVPQRKIASLVGVTYAAVNLIVTKIKRGEFKEPEPEDPPRHKPVTATVGRVIFQVDFTDHKDIYDFLIKESKCCLRTPEDQVIYMLQKERDGKEGLR